MVFSTKNEGVKGDWIKMVKVKQDLTGMRFGRLTVKCQGEDYMSGGRPIAGWMVSCDCSPNKIFRVRQKDLKRGHVASCGCLKRDVTIELNQSRKGKKLRKKVNNYDLSGDFGIGFTHKGEEFWFDCEDYDKIKDWCWYIDRDGYVTANIDRHPV